MSRSFVTATILCFVIGTGAAFAQAPTPAAQPSSTPEMSKPDKRAVSKACSDQANAKNLHGKVRKKFRSECKRNGGKAM
jgi:psiF repeat-containing protein